MLASKIRTNLLIGTIPMRRYGDRIVKDLLLTLVLTVGLSSQGSVQGQTDSNDPAPYYEGQPDRGDVSPMSPLSNRLTQHLWQSRIAPPDPNEDMQMRESIDELIHRIRSVTFDETSPTATFTPPPAEPASRTEPNATESVVGGQMNLMGPSMTVSTAETHLESTLSQAMLTQLEGLLQDPAQVRNPLEVAELLFLGGRPTEARVFYEKALALMSAQDEATGEDRAWALFQLGNCLRETDIVEAKEAYMKLIADYPSSPWTELAKAHGRLITWYQSANPQQFISQEESP